MASGGNPDLIGTPAKLEFFLQGGRPSDGGADIRVKLKAAYADGLISPSWPLPSTARGAPRPSPRPPARTSARRSPSSWTARPSRAHHSDRYHGRRGTITNMESIEAAQNLAMLITSARCPSRWSSWRCRPSAPPWTRTPLSTGLKAGIIKRHPGDAVHAADLPAARPDGGYRPVGLHPDCLPGVGHRAGVQLTLPGCSRYHSRYRHGGGRQRADLWAAQGEEVRAARPCGRHCTPPSLGPSWSSWTPTSPR